MLGDGEGGNEMTGSMQLIREFCDVLVTPEKARRTRIVTFYVFLQYTLFLYLEWSIYAFEML